jgi:uncharacterized protein (TIGR00375 family)
MHRVIADLHIHSRFSRAVSKELTIPNLAVWGQKKGITLIGTGDFTHPKWFAELRSDLAQIEGGFYESTSQRGIHFVPTVELSCIYRKNERTRRVHLVLVAPTLEAAERFNAAITKRGGKLASDGRPILGMDAKVVYEIALEISLDMVMIPAHAWTPWFGVFGSESGFDTLEECFEDLTPRIPAIETGLSSDPAMNWRLSKLDGVQIISCSDAHSLPNLGREATVFELADRTYEHLIGALSGQSKSGRILETLEFYPEEGKYHWDGHRACNTSMLPEKTKQLKGICPVCHRRLTVGVMNRVDTLADRPVGFQPVDRPPFRSLVPLQEIIAEAHGVGKGSKKVQREYEQLVAQLGGEFSILLDVSLTDVKSAASELVVEGIRRVRAGQIHITPGYDGVFGVVKVFSDDERKAAQPVQKSLFS